VRFRDLERQYLGLKAQMDEAIQAVIREGNFISGPQVRRLEKALAEYVGVEHCVTCANGTDALSLLLRAWGIGEGDAVFVPDFTFFASAETARDRGATPIFVDVSPDTFNMEPASLEQAILAVKAKGELRPRVIVAVDLFGMPADYRAIEGIAKKYGLLLLEDGAQGFGGTQAGRRACSFGEAAITSFFPAKPLGCYGDGGAIFIDDDGLAAHLRSLAVHGKGTDKYDNIRVGVNSRLDTLQAAVLLVKLEAFEREMEAVNRAAENYTRMLAGLVKTPMIPEGYTSAWAQYTIQLEDEGRRNLVLEAMKEAGVPAMVYYPKTMSEQTAFADILEAQPIACAVARGLCGRVVSLPFHPYMTVSEQEQVVCAIAGGLSERRGSPNG
jgi:dTDP-4-amino-4,6-dideoxygalactose transaminase